jgi:predicted house-cleaning noncanonical NTP pyrophosphatase (MazG superfamily)
MVYKWKSRVFPVDVQLAGEEIDRINQKYNGVSPVDVVNESKSEKSVLHKCFEWNDSKAAEGFREQQARVLIGNIVVCKFEKTDIQDAVLVRAFVNVKNENQKSVYVSIEEAMDNRNYEEQLFENAIKELESFTQKYKNLEQLKSLFEVIKKIVA